MGIPRVIVISSGKDEVGNTKFEEYYYWSDYDTREEALHYAKKIKDERKKMKQKIRYFILKHQEGRFLPVPIFVLYLNRKLRII